jgi:ubiquinone/menaquinone biosynthesis C-methylase UbiE
MSAGRRSPCTTSPPPGRVSPGSGGNDAEPLLAAYERWRSSRLGRITDALEERVVLDLLGPLRGERVLDVGCGDGALASALSRAGASVTGLDVDPRMLAAASRRIGEWASGEWASGVCLVAGRAERLPFRDATFDRVVAVAVLCFVREADRAVAEAARVLRPGGRLVIGELGRWGLWAARRRIRGWLGSPRWREAAFHSERELRELVAATPLEILDVRRGVYFPPCGVAARLLAPIDPWLGAHGAPGAAFLAVSAKAPGRTPRRGSGADPRRPQPDDPAVTARSDA